MKKIFVILAYLLFTSHQIEAQYFYQYLVNASWSAEHFAQVKDGGIKKIFATSYDAAGTADGQFSVVQTVEASQNLLTTISQSDFTGISYMVSQFNPLGRVLSTYDSNASVISRSNYFYNEKNQLIGLSIKTSDTVQAYMANEDISIQFDDDGSPASMVRIKDHTDTTQVIWKLSENGKPGEEHWFKKGKRVATWYYYYNTEGYLTDVAHFNVKARRITPVYTFDYNDEGAIISKTTVTGNSSNYRVWRIEYNSAGLKSREAAYNKQKQLEGFILYKYD